MDVSAEIYYIKKSIRYEIQHLVRLLNFETFENHNNRSEKWILVMLSRIVTCCKNCQILIRSPLKVKSLHLLSKFRGCISNGFGEKYFAKVIIYSKSPDHVLLNDIICSYFESLKFFRTAVLEPLRFHFEKIGHKIVKSIYFPNI